MSPTRCKSCGAYLEIVRQKATKKESLFTGVIYAYSALWVIGKGIYPELNQFVVFMVGLLILMFVGKKAFGISLFATRNDTTRETTKEKYEYFQVSPKRFLLLFVGISGGLIGLYFLVKLGLYYSPVGQSSVH
ncbi:hypothetical protein BTA51_19590 [Hahella sp. CCB-MM4]|nr:hypothetical protein BTA51_19590 [Hahella sp. CCB-MM4]